MLSGRPCPAQAFGFVAAPHTYVSRKDEGDKLVVLERGDVVMVFNFHPTNSYQDYRVGCLLPGPYKVRRHGASVPNRHIATRTAAAAACCRVSTSWGLPALRLAVG